MPTRLLAAAVIAMAPTFAFGQDADLAAGKKVFKKCAACHFVDKPKRKVGPSLQGVIGRTAGTRDKYKYSKAMSAAGEGGLVWTTETLDEYLVKPRAYVKGTKMIFPGLKKPGDRTNVIAYIKTFSPESE